MGNPRRPIDPLGPGTLAPRRRAVFVGPERRKVPGRGGPRVSPVLPTYLLTYSPVCAPVPCRGGGRGECVCARPPFLYSAPHARSTRFGFWVGRTREKLNQRKRHGERGGGAGWGEDEVVQEEEEESWYKYLGSSSSFLGGSGWEVRGAAACVTNVASRTDPA